EAAVAFYNDLFGWDDAAAPMGDGGGEHHNQMLDGALVAGMAAQDDEERSRGVPAHWNVYLAVDDAEAALARVPDAGGNVLMPSMDVMGLGNMARISDPTGGIVGLWEAKQHKGFGVVREPAAVSWCELITDDPARAAEFYSKVLEVPTQPMNMGDAPPYTLLG